VVICLHLVEVDPRGIDGGVEGERNRGAPPGLLKVELGSR
jgi:hypothetical protein